MNPNEPPPKDAATLKAERAKRNRDRLEAAITPQGTGSIGPRERNTPPVVYPLEPCNFKKWTNRDSIAIEQACFVLLGFEPRELDVLKFRQDTYNPTREPTWEAPPDYHDVLQSLRLSIEHGNISVKRIREGKYETKHVTMPDLVRWAKPKVYAVAPELESIIAKMEAAASDVPAQNTAMPATVVAVGALGGVGAGSNVSATTTAPATQGTQEVTPETADERCARLLKWLEDEKGRGERGALARVVKRDGRARQTVTADIKRAQEQKKEASNPMALMGRKITF